mgnify:CR=1 FL=1
MDTLLSFLQAQLAGLRIRGDAETHCVLHRLLHVHKNIVGCEDARALASSSTWQKTAEIGGLLGRRAYKHVHEYTANMMAVFCSLREQHDCASDVYLTSLLYVAAWG